MSHELTELVGSLNIFSKDGWGKACGWGGGGNLTSFLCLREVHSIILSIPGVRAIWKLQNICSSFWEFSHHLMGFN